ncbi:hypothetical protein MKW98_029760, partial [Papaver atlanticum]
LKVLVSVPIGSGKSTFLNFFNPEVAENGDAPRIILQNSYGVIIFTCSEI